MNIKNLGQVFTPNDIVLEMISLIKNNGKILEPSCGNGAFLKHLPSAMGVEIDENLTNHPRDFFTIDEKFDTIIGNPPYVRYQDIIPSTKELLPKKYDKRTNLYIFFIDRCIDLLNDGGELIFIVPRDFIKATYAVDLNKRLFAEGGFTFWKEFGDEKIFKDASPNVVIFRWVKKANHSIKVNFIDGFLFFDEVPKGYQIKDRFDVLVGGASGANNIFYHPDGNIDLVYSKTCQTGETIKAFYVDHPNEYLLSHKDELINRKIKKFNENTWFEWGRKIRHIDGEKIYVNMKTRNPLPFFTNQSGWFDGSILALVPKQEVDIDEELRRLNQNDWAKQGFVVDGRFIFGQKSLSSAFVSEQS